MKINRKKSLSIKPRIASLCSLVVLSLGLSFAVTAPTATAASFNVNDFTLNNDDLNPDDDVWYVRCAANTTIRANIKDDFWNDNTGHVSVSCVEPAARMGKGMKKVAIAPGQNPSPNATVGACRAALITYDCDENDVCDTSFDSTIACDGQPFNVAPVPKR